jgi:hypothetical protein
VTAADTTIMTYAASISSVAHPLRDDCRQSECVIVMPPLLRLSPTEKCRKPSEAEPNRWEGCRAV